MEVGGEVEPPVVAAGAQQRREERLCLRRARRGVDPRQQGIRAAIAELLHDAALVPARAAGRDPAAGTRLRPRPRTAMASRNGASRGDGWASRPFSPRFGSLSFSPKPLPPFHGLSTGVGTYSSASQAARSGTVVSMTSPSGAPGGGRRRVGLLAEQPDQAQAGQVASQRLGPQPGRTCR